MSSAAHRGPREPILIAYRRPPDGLEEGAVVALVPDATILSI